MIQSDGEIESQYTPPFETHVNPEQINNVQNGLNPEKINIDPQSQPEIDDINELYKGFWGVDKTSKYRNE